jgi:hypothetical protein
MKTWTNQAEQRLTEYLDERVRREGFLGEDGEELKADLRSHIHEEAEKLPGENMGLMQLEGILGNLDAGYRASTPYKPVPVLAEQDRSSIPPARWQPRGAWVWGVIFPLLVSLFELAAAFCGSVFFDPIATWWHTLIVFAVPLINWWLLKDAPRGSERVKGVAIGFSLVISIFYALLFIPLAPLSLIAVIYLGMGLLSLTPVFAGISTWRISRAISARSKDPAVYRRGRLAGIGIALLSLLVLEGPALWTRANLMAAKGGDSEKKEALERLRGFSSQRTLLRACYESGRGSTDISGWIAQGWNGPAQLFNLENRWSFDSNLAQELYFRVTGESFNSQKPPRVVRPGTLGRGSNPFNEVEFDSHLGGDQVAIRIKDLDMAQSRFDGHVDARSQLGYGEWTMVFKNSGLQAKEARCQVLMPRGGRVSRLTLWVNGEPREAAFNSVSKVKAAYKAIAVVQRRDPVLVTMSGPDTILVQCFPVPANGEMKIRFGITAPLDHGQWELPRILERNFGTVDSLEHSVWLQGDAAFSLASTAIDPRDASRDGPGFSMSASLEPDAAMGDATAVRMADVAPPGTVWCEDKFAAAYERYLIREPKPTRFVPAKLLLVIDGSASMEKAKPWLLETLKNDFPADAFPILLADDKATSVKFAQLESHTFTGGRDNEPALREAVRMAKSGEVDEIVWLHGPQAAGLSQSEALLQLIERGTRQPVIHTIMAENGPNRLAEALQKSGALRRGPALFDPRKDFSAFLTLLRTEHDEIGWHWKRSPQAPTEIGTPVWDHLARHWAIESVESKRSLLPEIDKPATAAKYQLVTSVSGAVVLETMEQYKQHGLEPVSATDTPQIPGVPEPSSMLLVMISATAALTRRRRRA